MQWTGSGQLPGGESLPSEKFKVPFNRACKVHFQSYQPSSGSEIDWPGAT